MLRNPDDALWYNSITPEQVRDGTIGGSALTRGDGCWVWDASGSRFLDARAALWNTTLGYSARSVVGAMTTQLRALPVGQVIRYRQPPAISLEYARRLVSALPGGLSHVRFGSTGSQMTTAAVLLSRFLRKVRRENDRTAVIGFRKSYHGTGGMASALSGERQLHALQSPLPPGVHHVPAWDLDALGAAVDGLGPDKVSAIILEPVLGTGVVPAPSGALARVRQLCDRHGIHLIADEVTTGFGRTGALSRMAWEGVEPDMLVLGKGITAGYVPLAALVTTDEVFDTALSRPDFAFPHGSTADAHPVAMAAGVAVLDVLADGTLFATVRERGSRLQDRLAELPVHDVRGVGLMIGVELRDDAGEPLSASAMARVHQECAAEGLLITSTDNTVVLMPPLVISERECDELVRRLGTAVRRARTPARV
ncbi:aminotransferase family protein [Saccharothrix coeruleofusca]|uniref:Adenosylmethionine-8-amino-7-oxononanoate aminotransferase n=1 Tax=Saccharothrix coeruleofusca TaxID=33919 RepID=A0A918EH44_9PSEU|nr:aminotransferase class III-fold pyridoxal phosphate-dependent enzyme [Saccharothrix coeruleofusca]MBP2336704.1 adenosylmethionine-8-amino-7-oxononanoate aminotransferase [Saccharothrix coeruleofusca]GGP78619.1 adenosylmethionine-8-amino-7-oxononanoate aminotransferase [Saccharothrix coeruleofusca]